MLLNLFKQLTNSKSHNKDTARKEYILNILLLGLIVLSSFACIVTTTNSFIYSGAYHGASPFFILGITLFLFILLALSHKGKSNLSSQIFVMLLLFVTIYTSYSWGADSPQALLMYSLIIVVAGILLGSTEAFVLTITTGFVILVLAYMEMHGMHRPDYSWKLHSVRMGAAIVFSITLGVIAIVSWLSNREIVKSLKRARNSEAALKRQRDKLEIRVAKRTKQLEQVQIEKLIQLYRFAEFGRLTSGLFHELVNPLNLISLNLNRLHKTNQKPQSRKELKVLLERARLGAQQLEKFIKAAKAQIQNQEILQDFSLEKEINQAIQILEYKAKELHIKIVFEKTRDIRTLGNPIKFIQIITNLVSNAIEAYEAVNKKTKRVEITMKKAGGNVEITVHDWGGGIKKENISKIFDPLFTTKSFEKGTGIGLSICKYIIEKDFRGTIQAESSKRNGTIFITKFPIRKENIGKTIRSKTSHQG